MRILHITDLTGGSDLIGHATALIEGAEWTTVTPTGLNTVDPGDLAIVNVSPEVIQPLAEPLRRVAHQALFVPPVPWGLASVDRAVRTMRRCGLSIDCLQTCFFHPGLAGLLELVGTGVLGVITCAEFSRRGDWPSFPKRNWDCRLSDGLYWDTVLVDHLLPPADRSCPVWEQTAAGGVWSLDWSPAIRLRADTGGNNEAYRFKVSVTGGGGAVEHVEEINDKGWISCSLKASFANGNSRCCRRTFAPGLPLAAEISYAGRHQPAPMNKSRMRHLGSLARIARSARCDGAGHGV